MLAASRLPTSSWRALGRSFYGRPIGTSRSRTCSGTCQTLCHRTRLCQCMSTRSARMDGESAAERLSDPPDVWEGRVVELLREIRNRHGGSFDPSRISHKAMGRAPEDERAYGELNRLLKPNELKPFVDQHPEFAWSPTGKKGMIITWG